MVLRQTRNATLGALLGLYGSTWAIAAITAATAKPVTGCACITIGLACALLGALAGAAVEEF